MRRAEALGEICRRFLDHHAGVIGGQRPHVSVIVDLDTLVGRGGERSELARTGTITPETARRILCDAEVTRVIVDGDSAPLEMGRSVRTATPAQRKALAIRDGGCTWPGCGRPPDIGRLRRRSSGGRVLLGLGATTLDRVRLRRTCPCRCDVHHSPHWIDGGVTDLDKLNLLCKRHHIAEHAGQPRPGTAHDHTIQRR